MKSSLMWNTQGRLWLRVELMEFLTRGFSTHNIMLLVCSPLHAGILHPAHGTPVLGARHQGAGRGAGRRGRGTAAYNMTADSYTADTDDTDAGVCPKS